MAFLTTLRVSGNTVSLLVQYGEHNYPLVNRVTFLPCPTSLPSNPTISLSLMCNFFNVLTEEPANKGLYTVVAEHIFMSTAEHKPQSIVGHLSPSDS